MKFGIIAAMEQELVSLLEKLEDRKDETILDTLYYSGRISNQEVVMVQSGIGKVMSAMSVAILISHFKVDAIINTGSAGAVADGLSVGDIVIADRLAYHDVDVTAFGYDYGQMARQPLYFESYPKFIQVFKEVIARQDSVSKIGLIATGDSFIASQERIDGIKEYFNNVLAVEMEGAAIAQAAYNAGKPFIVIRAMSDTADHNASVSFDEFIIEAGKKSAEMLSLFLETI